MDYQLALMTGVDFPIADLQLIIHQPTIEEISRVGEDTYFQVIHYLCLNKETLIEDKNLSDNLTNFQVLLKVIEQTNSELKASFSSVLSLFFPNKQSVFTPKSLLLVDSITNETMIIDSNNYDILQQVLKDISCINSLSQGDNVIYKPGNDAAQKIAEKILKARKKVAALKTKEKESLLTRYLSILTVGLPSMSLKDCENLTMFQLFDLVERYNLFIAWDMDLRCRFAGGDPKGETKNWMKNIH